MVPVDNQTDLASRQKVLNANNPYSGIDSFLSNVSNFKIIESTLRG